MRRLHAVVSLAALAWSLAGCAGAEIHDETFALRIRVVDAAQAPIVAAVSVESDRTGALPARATGVAGEYSLEYDIMHCDRGAGGGTGTGLAAPAEFRVRASAPGFRAAEVVAPLSAFTRTTGGPSGASVEHRWRGTIVLVEP